MAKTITDLTTGKVKEGSVVDFWATWCDSCHASSYSRKIIRLSEE